MLWISKRSEGAFWERGFFLLKNPYAWAVARRNIPQKLLLRYRDFNIEREAQYLNFSKILYSKSFH